MRRTTPTRRSRSHGLADNSMKQPSRRLRLHEAATYSIRVQGMLDNAWSDRLGGMQIDAVTAGGDTSTLLTGQLPDQSALISVLTSLYDLGLPLLSVERTGQA